MINVQEFVRFGRSVVLGCALLCAFPILSAIAQQQGGQTLNLRDADIRAFIEDVSRLTGKSFIIDPRVQGTVTLISRDPVATEDMLEILFSTLRANGFSAVPTAGGSYRVIPIDQAAQDGTRIGVAGQMGDSFVTEVFHLSNIDTVAAGNLIRPMVNAQGQVVSSRGSQSLIVIDFASNMQRIRQALQSIDRDTSDIRTISLANTAPAQMARIVRELTRVPGEGLEFNSLLAIPVEGSNTLVLKGDAAVVDRMSATIADLDARNRLSSDIRVYYLRYAVARELLPLLQQVTQSLAPTSGVAIDDSAGGGPGSQRASIAVDNATNALVVSAPPETQQAIQMVIEQLDIRRAQVLVEAIIVEVSDTAAHELGLQYILSGSGQSGLPFSMANYSDTAPNILAATGALVATSQDPDSDVTRELQRTAIQSLFGLNGFALGGAGLTGGTLFGVILNAFDQDDESNILSTPSLMTMDNETASIIVGSEIPITTGETLGADNSNPFRTVERKDIGVQLNVQPQISEGDTIKLYISQEVSSVQGVVGPTVPELITSKRRIETTVSVDDGEILVLGGLIQNDEQITVDKIPFLGDLPVVGAAFRSEARSNRRTNLMVFIRPTIIRGAEDAQAVTDRKYDYMRGEQILRGAAIPSLDLFQRDVLGVTVPSVLPSTIAAPAGE